MNCPFRYSLEIEKTIQEECGIVALYTKNPSYSLKLALLAARAVQHRGQQGVGLAMQANKDLLHCKKNGLLQDVFSDEVISEFDRRCKWILIHCRYGTHGGYSQDNLQPCIETTSRAEKFAVIHNGEFIAVEQLSKKNAQDISDTYLFAKSLALEESLNWDEKVLKCLQNAKGAYSLTIGVRDTLFVARDRCGIRPLFLGEIGRENWLVASETHAFDKVGAKVKREVQRGEILKINSKGLTVLQKGNSSREHFCDFELAYFSRPDSRYRVGDTNKQEWQSFASFRERCGVVLAEEYSIQNASFVVGVPDSGIALATGYAQKLNIPYRQVIIRDHFDPDGAQRLFMRDDQIDKIESKVLGKISLIPDREIWQDAVVVVGDDSIVRGKVAKQITKAMFSLGAKEIHWVIGFPPVSHPCHLGVSIRTDGELISPRNQSNPERIASEIGATSTNYISLQGFLHSKFLYAKVKTPKNPKEIFLANGGCGGCVTGLYPVAKNGRYYYDLKVCLLDPGGRGNALAREILKSEKVKQLWTSIYATKENKGGEKVKLYRYNKYDPVKQALEIVQREKIDLVVIGPENPLAGGLVDKLLALGVAAFGPLKELTWLESDKAKAKLFMGRWNIPVSNYRVFTDFPEAKKYISSSKKQLVVKAAGLAAGKGSIVCNNKEQAIKALERIMLKREFGSSGDKVVIEDRLFGIEQSVTAITDGKSVILAPTARDYKQRYDGNEGLNTGGMGSHSPSGNESIFSEKKVLERIINPALEGITKETGKLYKGVLYAGLMWVNEDNEWNPYVLEFNIRFGDPEAQVILPRLKSPNWVDMFLAVINGNLKEIECKWSEEQYLTVCAVSGEVPANETKGKGRYPGYPGRYKTHRIIKGLDSLNKSSGYVLHSGTAFSNGEYVSTGGRVLSVVSSGKNARRNVYEILKQIDFDYMDYRKDIGSPKLLKEERNLLGYPKIRLAILISGSGSTMENIIKACHNNRLPNVEPVGVISSSRNADGIKKAKKLGVETVIVNPKNYQNREDFGNALLKILDKWDPDLISQNGWLPLTPINVVKKYNGKIINQHPAPLDPEHKNGKHYDFGGKGMYGITPHAATLYFRKLILENGKPWYAKRYIYTEATVHLVNERFDEGDVIKRTKMNIYDNDSPESIQQRLLPIEHETVIAAIKDFALRRVSVEKRPKPFVRQGEEKFLYEAKKRAIEKYR